jgi:signal transduction histidine kinase
VLALALRDPSAELVFVLPERAGHVDRAGRPVPLPAGDRRARAPVEQRGRVLGVLLHDPALRTQSDLLHSVLAAAGLAIEIAALRVEVRVQLAEVRRSRARIVAAGYEERRRLERDLHDGAQARLVGLGLVLRKLQRAMPRDAQGLAPTLDGAVDEVARAIGDLRTIAAGVRPPRLDDGLGAALAELARTTPVPVEVEATRERAPSHIEAAAYFVACEAITNAVKHGAPTRVRVRAERRADRSRLLVSDDEVGGASRGGGTGLVGLEDRVAARGGSLAIHSVAGAGTRIEAEFPCAS